MKAAEKFSKREFLCPKTPYYGRFTPESFVFNANLQEFAQRITYISNLHTGGKLSSQEAYQQIKTLWQQLDQSQDARCIGEEC